MTEICTFSLSPLFIYSENVKVKQLIIFFSTTQNKNVAHSKFFKWDCFIFFSIMHNFKFTYCIVTTWERFGHWWGKTVNLILDEFGSQGRKKQTFWFQRPKCSFSHSVINVQMILTNRRIITQRFQISFHCKTISCRDTFWC